MTGFSRAVGAALLVMVALFGAAFGAARTSGLPWAADLAADAAQSAATGAAILIFYMSDDCPYCQHVEELYLEPMQQRRPYGDRLLIRVVRADGHKPLRDFSGRRTDHATFARRHGASFTPLIQLYGPDGTALTSPLVGYTSPDFYAGELEGRIDDAIGKLRLKNAAASER